MADNENTPIIRKSRTRDYMEASWEEVSGWNTAQMREAARVLGQSTNKRRSRLKKLGGLYATSPAMMKLEDDGGAIKYGKTLSRNQLMCQVWRARMFLDDLTSTPNGVDKYRTMTLKTLGVLPEDFKGVVSYQPKKMAKKGIPINMGSGGQAGPQGLPSDEDIKRIWEAVHKTSETLSSSVWEEYGSLKVIQMVFKMWENPTTRSPTEMVKKITEMYERKFGGIDHGDYDESDFADLSIDERAPF